jgi:outer membrane autotransporter protein
VRPRNKPSKQTKRTNQAKHTLLAASIAAALFCITPAYAAGPELPGETVDKPDAGAAPLVIGAGQTITTWAGATQSASYLYGNGVTIESGGIWRPMDVNGVSTHGGILTIKNGATLDLSYKYEDYAYDVADAATWKSLKRGFGNYVDNAATGAATKTVLYDGAILKGTIYGKDYRTQFNFMNPQLGEGESSATVRVQLRYDKSFFSGKNSGVPAGSWEAAQATTLQNKVNSIVQLTVRNTTEDKAALAAVVDKLNFVAENSYIDDALHKYLLTSKLTPVTFTPGTSATRSYNLDWTATRTDLLSQGVFSAANAQLSLRNLWRMEDGLFYKRGEDLRNANRLGPSESADGAWAQVWRGKYDFDGAIGSSFGQSYDGIQVGYDKQREGKLFGGKLYSGLFLSLLNSDADFHQHSVISDNGVDKALYSHSGGDLESKGLGLYTTWIGDKGHYLDVTVRGSKLSNHYKYFDSDDSLHENDYGTWAYGAGLRYGYQKELPGGWFLEPQAGLSYGTMKGYSYTQDNNMRYTQDEMKMLIGRFGLTAGRNFTSGDKSGAVYAKAAVNHDFKDSGNARADALYRSGQQYLVGATLPMDTLAGKDTWYEFALGTTLQTGKDQNAFVELTKTTGGKVNTDWQVNAGLSWRFNNGPVAHDRQADIDNKITALAAAPAAAPDQSGIPAATLTPSAGDSGGDSQVTAPAPAEPPAGQAGQAGQTQQPVPVEQPVAAEQSSDQAVAAFTTGRPALSAMLAPAGDREPGSYTLAPLVVEAARPDWEKKLSPGTVSVIHVPEYKGEMKNLPDLLQTVPGVYVQRLQGTGHYTVARVRGSTGGQVNIYVDGVLLNSASEAAVDLSTVPIENVERVEVYRGYVPARFAGSPLGGAINIVTKKPTDTKGSISAGMRSFGGYTGNLELTAPVGSGSMLFALNRDQAVGDFRYDHHRQGNPKPVERRRLNNDYHNTDALLKWQDDNWFAKLTWQENRTAFPDSTGGVLYPDTNAKPNRYQEIEKTALSVGRRQTAGNLEWGWRLDGSYQYKEATEQQAKSLWSGNNIVLADNEFRNRRYEGAIDGSWQMGQGHLVEFMFDASRETMTVDSNNYQKWPNWDGTVNGGIKEQYRKFFKNDYRINNYYFQVQDTMTINKSGNLFFTPLVRAQKMTLDIGETGTFDLDPDIDSWKYSYNLALKKVQNDHWTFRGTYGTYYKFPNFYEMFGDGVNVRSRWDMFKTTSNQGFLLQSFVERGTSWDIGANWQGKALNADADVTLTYFNRRSKNLLSYALDPYGFGYYTNIGAGNIQGLELESKLSWQRFDLLLAGTWNDSLITKGGTKPLVGESEMNVGNPFPWIPEWEANARLGYRFPGDKLSAFVEYHYLGEVGTAITAADTGGVGYHLERKNESLGLTNLGLKYAFNQQLKLTAGVNDLFNKGPDQIYRFYSRTDSGRVENLSSSVTYPQQGRTYYMTMQYFF